MARIGRMNSITDVAGVLVGHYTNREAVSGVTVTIFPEGAVTGVDVRGSAPGTRETDCLDPVNMIRTIHGIMLGGGSVFGLSAADGVVRWLAEKGWGFPMEDLGVLPIVPAAILYDCNRGPAFVPPVDAGWGRDACEAATDGEIAQGSVGAGTGALAGGMKGGVGTASEALDSGITVGAMVAVNSLGLVVDPATGSPWEIRLEIGDEFGALGRRAVRVPEVDFSPRPATNTTIGVVATDAVLTKAQCRKIAQMAHDGMARSIRPAHTMFDGDTLFCAATCKRELPDTPGFFESPKAFAINELGRAAADCVSRAIVHAIVRAETIGDMIAFADLPEK